MSDRFLACLAVTLRHEGGFVNDPQDPGGATNLGITIDTLGDWRGKRATPEDVRALTLDEAREIYRARYWNRARCDDLPPGLDLMAFDCTVNPGTSAGPRLLQQAVAVRADGAVGPVTIAAAREADVVEAINRMAALRAEYYRSRPGFPRFGKGWLRRTEDVRLAALEMAAQPAPALPAAPDALAALTSRVAALEARLAAMGRALG